MDIDKKIAEIEENNYKPINIEYLPNREDGMIDKEKGWLIDQLKECREEIDRLEKIEQRTKEACKEACRQKVKTKHPPDGLYLYEIEQAIDSVGKK